MWQSVDPIIGKYLDGAAGGVHNSFNLGVYGYAYQRPLIMRDPDGNIVFLIPVVMAIAKAAAISAATGAVSSAAISAGSQYATTGNVNMNEVGKDALIGGALGGVVGGVVKGVQVARAAGTALKHADEAKSIHSALIAPGTKYPKKAFNSRTTGVASSGSSKVATGSGTNALSPAQREVAKAVGAKPIMSRGARVHAEPKALNALSGSTGDVSIGVSRTICSSCSNFISSQGGAILNNTAAIIPRVNAAQSATIGGVVGAASSSD